ncbi:tetratricopeptide repeat-containing protein [Novosphingobium nitrogenifigens DSM 19370]|uniref:Tetratricopeptide repeat-containing protein n=2 Tax=Novosphingobium nitrogenifigens TaxID=378548 RepID=F1ZD41_9SPHN|nr:tetratricopeptide repeat-containing sulfotransferase family protein [Novosphingobium nitrogenifigens]EGD57472.1 tetratricopeptide repeat-containing protein [Novosphingobium nitrogenifigens DSM 19370]
MGDHEAMSGNTGLSGSDSFALPAGATGSYTRAIERARYLLDRAPGLAEEQAREILAVVPASGEAHLVRGLALAGMHRLDEAVTALRESVRRSPDNYEAWRALGEQLVLLGDSGGADFAFAQQLRCQAKDPQLQAAAVAMVRNDVPVAERLLKQFLKQHPTDIAALRMLAEVAGRIGRYRDAIYLLEHALELAPSFDTARFNLATALYRFGENAKALEQLDLLLAKQPRHSSYRNLAAAALGRIGDLDAAIAHYEYLVERHPAASKIWMSYGHSLKTVGRQADAVDAYRRCIALEPGYGEAWWSLANLKTVHLGKEDIAAMTSALADGAERLSVEDRYHLHFAIGKAHEDLGQDEEAFAAYDDGNRLRRTELHYDADEMSALVDRSIRTLTPAFFAGLAGGGCNKADPIFIVGMPRAGSTLIEQILASHPMIEGTQELPEIMAIARRLGAEHLESKFPETLSPKDKLAELGEEYLRETRIQRRTDRPLFIDKMPNNWQHIGLIHLILPNAKIIDARRHPLACGYSNFKQHFARGQAFSYDLTTMGRYYADYVRLMDHFDTVLPGRVLRVFHEAVIEDTEAQVRRLLDYVGVDFDPACLRFHENRRPVRTASSEQVRRPINRDGMDQWQRFDRWLDPLREALGPVLETYPYA